MKNISREKRKPNDNVLSIASSPKFKPLKKYIPLPSTVSNAGRFDSFILDKNLFGFIDGDELVCRTDFNESQISANTLVIVATANGQQLQTAATAKGEILAVVVAFTREVVQG